MLRDRYEPMALLTLVPTLRFAMEPVLAQLDRLLDDDRLFQHVKADLRRRAPHTATRGRPSTPVEVILQMLVVKRLYRWSDTETDHRVADSLVLRQCCRVSLGTIPDDTTLLRWVNLIEPATLAALNERVAELARSLKVTRGLKIRADSPGVATTIHHPTDSGLRGDGVGVLSRLLRRAKAVVGQAVRLGPQVFRSRLRSVRRLLRQLPRLARQKGESATAPWQRASERLVAVARQTPAQALSVCTRMWNQTVPRVLRLIRQFEPFLPRAPGGSGSGPDHVREPL